MNDSATRRPRPPLDLDEAPELSDKMLAHARPASEVHGAERAAKMLRRRGRPAKPENERKQQVTLRLSRDVLAALRATGEGWQTRLDEQLRSLLLPEAAQPTLTAPVSTHVGSLDVEATIKARIRAADDKPKQKGATLFERMASLSRDERTGEFSDNDTRDAKAHQQRADKKRA